MQALNYHVMEEPDLTNPHKPMPGYFDFGEGRILPVGLTEAQRLQAVIDSKRRSREHLLSTLHSRCAELRSHRHRR